MFYQSIAVRDKEGYYHSRKQWTNSIYLAEKVKQSHIAVRCFFIDISVINKEDKFLFYLSFDVIDNSIIKILVASRNLFWMFLFRLKDFGDNTYECEGFTTSIDVTTNDTELLSMANSGKLFLLN